MNKTTLKYWLFNAPMFFAIWAFITTLAFIVLANMLLPQTHTSIAITGLAITLALAVIMIQTIRRIPIKKIDRTGFVTLTNIQTIFSSIFLVAISLFMIATQSLSMTFSTIKLIGLFITATLLTFSVFYIIGLATTGIWARFLRARTMNIPTWKIICSYPFAFDMLWMPGYFIPNKKDKNPTITTEKKWIAKLTAWTMASAKNAAILLTILFIVPGLFNSMSALLLTLCTLMLFAIWIMRIGAKKFEKNIGGIYATTAVIINIAILVYTAITVIYLM